MAQGKKSFIAYSDWRDIFTELPDEEAGKLIKHIFAYVNDESPVSDSVLIRASFASIKSTLKRDLEKWDKQLQQRKDAGIQSGISRATKSNERSTVVNETERNQTVSVNVSVSDSVNDNEKKYNKRFTPPTLLEVTDYFLEKGYSDSSAKKAWEYYEAGNWKDSKGNQVKSWKQKMQGVWFKPENLIVENKRKMVY